MNSEVDVGGRFSPIRSGFSARIDCNQECAALDCPFFYANQDGKNPGWCLGFPLPPNGDQALCGKSHPTDSELSIEEKVPIFIKRTAS
jgi:hypothetical protein